MHFDIVTILSFCFTSILCALQYYFNDVQRSCWKFPVCKMVLCVWVCVCICIAIPIGFCMCRALFRLGFRDVQDIRFQLARYLAIFQRPALAGKL